MRLKYYLIDCTEVHIIKHELKLFFMARELNPESEVDCFRCFHNNFEFFFCEFVVVDFHCFKNYSVKHS